MTAKTLKPAKKTAKTEVRKPAKAKEKKALKPVAARAKTVHTVDENLARLAASAIPMTFVRKHEGAWDHGLWLEFLAMIEKKGYSPIDADRVGLILEETKVRYFAEKA